MGTVSKRHDRVTRNVGGVLSSTLKISLVVPTYNRPRLLYRALYTLLHQNASNYEVIVLNDDDLGVHMETEKVCAEFDAQGMPIRCFYTGKYKRGFGWSVETYPYNVGIRMAVGDIIILNSGDVMSVTNTIAEHRQRHTNRINDKLVVLSTVHGLHEDVISSIDNYPWKDNPESLLFEGSCEFMYCGKGKSYAKDRTKEGLYVESLRPYHYQMSVSKKVLHYLRGFDEDFYGRMGGGDDDLACRLIRHKCKIVYDPDILAIHQWHPQFEVFAQINDASYIRPSEYWEQVAQFNMDVVRNKNHEWGQFPRNI